MNWWSRRPALDTRPRRGSMTDESREDILWQGRVPTVEEVAEWLRWSTWHAMNRHPKVCGFVSEERLDDCADSAMTEIKPVVEDFIGRLAVLRAALQDAWKEVDRLNTLPDKLDVAYGDEQWAVFYGGPDPANAACTEMRDDENDAREHIQWVPDSGIAHRPIWFGHWQVDGEDQS